MKIYEIKLKPKTFFISQLQGDMLFGCLCWQLLHIGQNLDELLKDYDTNPFMVVSSGVYFEEGRYLLPKPLCPDNLLAGKTLTPEEKKDFKNKKFICLFEKEPLYIDNDMFEQNEEVVKNIKKSITQEHNSINRLTNTTGSSAEFAPFYTKAHIYRDKGEIVVFVALDELKLPKEELRKAFINLGRVGFGKKASSGYGHFEVKSIEESNLWCNFKDFDYNFLYTLAPFVPSEEEQKNINTIYFQPFTKYGKHGDVKAISDGSVTTNG